MTELSNVEISEVFKEWATEMNMPVRDILFSTDGHNTITIYTDRPGLLIGKAGMRIDKYIKKLNEMVNHHNETIARMNSNPDREFTLLTMPEVKIYLREVQRADFWLNYDPMLEDC